MENFAAVIRTLLARIRAFQASQAKKPWPPAAPDTDRRRESLYRVAPTTWGVAAPHTARPTARRQAPRRPAPDADAGAVRRGLELTVYGLPAPRGLVTT